MSNDTIDAAVESAIAAYDAADKSPVDHGFAHIEGIDGRTTLARELESHPKVNTDNWDYVTIKGLNRYLSAQRAGYSAFIDTLKESDMDVSGIYQLGRLD